MRKLSGDYKNIHINKVYKVKSGTYFAVYHQFVPPVFRIIKEIGLQRSDKILDVSWDLHKILKTNTVRSLEIKIVIC